MARVVSIMELKIITDLIQATGDFLMEIYPSAAVQKMMQCECQVASLELVIRQN